MISNKKGSIILLLSSILLLSYIGLIVQSQLVANQILFQPPLTSYVDSTRILKLKTRDGKQISAIFLLHPKSKFVILYSHGNAIDLGGLYPLLLEFHAHDLSIFAYDYHGYGTSQGRPSEHNTYLDIDAAYHYLTHVRHIPSSKIVAMGVSLGAGVTLDLARRKPLAGVILQSSFISAFRVFTVLPLLPFDLYNNLKKIKHLKVPILFIHGYDDRVIPFWHSERLFDAYPYKKYALWVKNADHNNLTHQAGDDFWKTIHQFLATLGHSPA